MRLILRLLANAAALAVATFLLSGITINAATTQEKILTLLFVALIFGVINAAVKPIFKLVSLPVVLLTLGLFLVVINALLLMLTSWVAERVRLGWHVEGFWTAVVGSLIVSVVSVVLGLFVPEKKENRRRG
ncbi:MAG: phage holin family protein [Propionibacteriaceae bacterium]